MKIFCTFLALVVGTLGAFLSGCAIAERDISDVGNQFQEGIRGRGQIVENNPTEDSFGPEFR